MKSRTLTCITAIMLFAALDVPVQLAAQVSGIGITNRIPIWTHSMTLGNSNLFQTGGKVGVGTTSPAATLDVIGPTATTAGAAALTVLRVTGGRGGSLPLGTFGSAGAGGGLQLTSGNGGSAGSAPGGGLARIMITGGTGGSCIPASTRCAFVAGKGGSISLLRQQVDGSASGWRIHSIPWKLALVVPPWRMPGPAAVPDVSKPTSDRLSVHWRRCSSSKEFLTSASRMPSAKSG